YNPPVLVLPTPLWFRAPSSSSSLASVGFVLRSGSGFIGAIYSPSKRHEHVPEAFRIHRSSLEGSWPISRLRLRGRTRARPGGLFIRFVSHQHPVSGFRQLPGNRSDRFGVALVLPELGIDPAQMSLR